MKKNKKDSSENPIEKKELDPFEEAEKYGQRVNEISEEEIDGYNYKKIANKAKRKKIANIVFISLASVAVTTALVASLAVRKTKSNILFWNPNVKFIERNEYSNYLEIDSNGKIKGKDVNEVVNELTANPKFENPLLSSYKLKLKSSKYDTYQMHNVIVDGVSNSKVLFDLQLINSKDPNDYVVLRRIELKNLKGDPNLTNRLAKSQTDNLIKDLEFSYSGKVADLKDIVKRINSENDIFRKAELFSQVFKDNKSFLQRNRFSPFILKNDLVLEEKESEYHLKFTTGFYALGLDDRTINKNRYRIGIYYTNDQIYQYSGVLKILKN
ncbi:hypothetical membrane protein [Metamycoplasma arthritidis]|uniref:Hypothetical membrane protein n=1 Tax=Metamycoplasma arthritidis (strain 158L3-1) TaxID=243272 RepID=B3PN63_META1|nr:hypothetical protein [Metamycoplasma arthritidis]ACF07465.1 hypothetical membrane protein [Metamycoplasma arthritidis 158L3-1]VEU78986.1 hypothetical membrane protein [Metamycoplasma arthritidis]